jgi:hypothetical protein
LVQLHQTHFCAISQQNQRQLSIILNFYLLTTTATTATTATTKSKENLYLSF